MKSTVLKLSRDGGWKYRALATALESAIHDGRLAAGSRLTSERELAAEHGITVVTVRRALDVLVDKGLVSRQQGRGTFVVSSSARAAPAPVVSRPIGLIGLNPDPHTAGNTVNWQLQLRRLQGIVNAATELGLQVQTGVEFDPRAPLPGLIEHLKRYAGLVLHDESLPVAVLPALRDAGMPVVAINGYLGVEYCSRIHVNSRLGAFRAVSHLIDLGHRRIACLVGDPARLSMRERLDGYRDALATRGLPLDDALVVIEPRGWAPDAAEAAGRLLARPERPTAVFAASDYRALGVLERLAREGVAVPAAMSVIGFDDILEARAAQPPLSTVANPHYESGRLAARLLHEQIVGGRPEVVLRVMECPLQVRGTCAAAPRTAGTAREGEAA